MLCRKAAKIYAYELVSNGKYCFQQLDPIERRKLTGLLLSSTPKFHAFEYVSDADAKTEVPYLLARYLENGCNDDAWSLIGVLCENACNAMANQIDVLLSEQESELNFDKRTEVQ